MVASCLILPSYIWLLGRTEMYGTVGKQSKSPNSLFSKVIGNTVKQHFNRPLLEFGTLLTSNSADHCEKPIHPIHLILWRHSQ